MGNIVTFKAAAAARSGRVRHTKPAKILFFIGVQYCRDWRSEGVESGRGQPDAGPTSGKGAPQRPPKKRA
jgi:hypothetical protein